LLHEIRTIPRVLGWPQEGLRLEGSLPFFVLSAIRSMNDSTSVWKFILDAAHELTGDKVDFDGTVQDGGSVIRCHWPPFAPAGETRICNTL
jgi:hypothetical protein